MNENDNKDPKLESAFRALPHSETAPSELAERVSARRPSRGLGLRWAWGAGALTVVAVGAMLMARPRVATAAETWDSVEEAIGEIRSLHGKLEAVADGHKVSMEAAYDGERFVMLHDGKTIVLYDGHFMNTYDPNSNTVYKMPVEPIAVDFVRSQLKELNIKDWMNELESEHGRANIRRSGRVSMHGRPAFWLFIEAPKGDGKASVLVDEGSNLPLRIEAQTPIESPKNVVRVDIDYNKGAVASLFEPEWLSGAKIKTLDSFGSGDFELPKP